MSFPFVPSGFFAFRSPLLSLEELTGWGAALRAPAAEPGALGDALTADQALLRERLRQLVQRPEVREALFVASPVLDESLPAWLQAPDSEAGKKVERTLVRYFSRMTARSTPFGLFAGQSVGLLGAHTSLQLEARQTYRRHTRLDMDYVCVLIDALAARPDLQRELTYRPNSSLYRAAGRLRYAESRRGSGRTLQYNLVAVEPTSYLEAVLERARTGARTGELARMLTASDRELTFEESEEYVLALVDSQLLVPDLLPAVTGPEPLEALREAARTLPGLSALSAPLEAAHASLEQLDAGSLGTAPEHYRALARDIEQLPVPVELPRLFQVDLVKPAREATLGTAVVEALSQAAQLLYRLQSRGQEDALSRFRTRFAERYEEREVPLVEALDEESGIGFDPSTAPSAEASPLLAGLAFPPSGAEQSAQGDERVTHLASLVSRALQQGSLEVNLQEEDLRRLEPRSPRPPPDAFCVMATLAAPSDEALARGDFQLVVTGVDGPSGARMLGRFCHGNPELQGHVEAHLRAEEALRPEAVFAELVHLPAGRIGNVLCRPVLRAHEIPYLGRSGAAQSQQLPVTDLHLSIQGGRILLRSASLDREVVPRLTNAHNHGGPNLGLYRFLAALRAQDGAGAAFSWGALSNAEFLPRLRVGRTVLTRAHWRVDAARLKRWADARGSELFRELQAFRAEARLPRFVAVEDADNVLPVDLDNVLSIESFVQLVRKRSAVTLTELYPTPDLLCAKGPEGRYAHELVVPFVRAAAPATTAVRSRRLPERLQPLHAPGSEWLFAKLYGGTATVDQLLRSLVPELLRPALESGAARRWFFLRYGDPQWHLRLRVGGDSARLHAEVLPRLHELTKPLLADGSLWKVQLDTYVPEVARYGGTEGLALSERLFEADSEAALHILQALPGEEAADGRWRLALRGMDALLDDLGLTLEQKAQVLRTARKNFGEEFRVDGGFERQLGDRFRKERRSLETLLDPASDAASPLAEALAGLHRRSEKLRPVGAALAEAQAAGRLELPLVALASTYLHMHANRLLRSAARAQELVLYDFLLRLYESRLARLRKGQ